MPRISASTVAEHREVQTRALLDAARGIIAETGARPSLAEVARRAGLARSSVYQYFKSADELLFAVVYDIFPRWQAHVEQALVKAKTPSERVLTYVYANLKLVDSGEHAVAKVLQNVELTPEVSQQSLHMHKQLRLPLLEALRDLGEPDVATSSALITSILGGGTALLERGSDLADVWPATRRLLAAYTRQFEQ